MAPPLVPLLEEDSVVDKELPLLSLPALLALLSPPILSVL